MGVLDAFLRAGLVVPVEVPLVVTLGPPRYAVTAVTSDGPAIAELLPYK